MSRKGTGTFFGLAASMQRDDQTGRKMSQSPAACGVFERVLPWFRLRLPDLVLPMWLLFLLMAISPFDFSTNATRTAALVVLASGILTPWLFRHRVSQVVAVFAVVCLTAILAFPPSGPYVPGMHYVWQVIHLAEAKLGVMGIGALVAMTCLLRPLRFGLSIAAVFLAGHLWLGSSTGVIHQERSFFGVLRVRQEAAEKMNYLVHGSTTHGAESGRGKTPPTVDLLLP